MKKLFALLIFAAICALPRDVEPATGCNYPASIDSFSDLSTGDFLTVARVNTTACAIEKLESGPLRPNKGSASAPAHSFQGDTNTGVDSLAATTVSIITGGTERVRVGSSGITTGTWAASVIGSQFGGTGAALNTCAQGSIPYFSATGVQSCLAPGTSGQALTTNGAGANPTWTGGQAQILHKAVDEIVNNSNTLQNDDHLVCAVEASKDYLVEAFLLLLATGGTTPDFKFAWTFPASAVIFWGPGLEIAAGGSNTNYWIPRATGNTPDALLTEGTTYAIGSGAVNATTAVAFTGIMRNVNAGNLQLQWAQNTANASDSKILKGSTLRCTRLN